MFQSPNPTSLSEVLSFSPFFSFLVFNKAFGSFCWFSSSNGILYSQFFMHYIWSWPFVEMSKKRWELVIYWVKYLYSMAFFLIILRLLVWLWRNLRNEKETSCTGQNYQMQNQILIIKCHFFSYPTTFLSKQTEHKGSSFSYFTFVLHILFVSFWMISNGVSTILTCNIIVCYQLATTHILLLKHDFDPN